MFRLYTLIIAIFLPVVSLFAGDDLTKPDFMVNLADMDPMYSGGGGYAGGGLQWTGAVLFILHQLSNILLYIVPLLAGISLVVAGFYYIFSSGDSEKASKAKTIIKWNIVAMIVAFLSYGLVSMVLYIMNINS